MENERLDAAPASAVGSRGKKGVAENGAGEEKKAVRGLKPTRRNARIEGASRSARADLMTTCWAAVREPEAARPASARSAKLKLDPNAPARSPRSPRKKQEREEITSDSDSDDDSYQEYERRECSRSWRLSGRNIQDVHSSVGVFAVKGPDAHEHEGSENELDNLGTDSITEAKRSEVFEAHLARDDDHDMKPASNKKLPLVEVTIPKGDSQVVRKGRGVKICAIFAGAILILMVVLGVGYSKRSASNSRKDGDRKTIPTSAPTSSEDRDGAIIYFLESNIGTGVKFEAGSPQRLAAEWIVADDPMRLSMRSKNLLQRFILALVYFQTTIPVEKQWKRCNPPKEGDQSICIEGTKKSRWLSGANECDWFGISCDRTGAVVKIDLDAFGLVGSIPSEISELSKLQYLNLMGNGLSGSISESLFELKRLTLLDLGFMALTGTISSNIGKLSALEYLFLTDNQLQGSIPSSIGNLTSLKIFGVGGNTKIEGTIPAEIYGLTKLDTLGLYETSLTGTVSSMIGHLTDLIDILLYDSSFSGDIPIELGRCTKLQFLQFSRNSFTGEIPHEFGSLTELTSLAMSGNQMEGSIPEELFDMTKLLVFEANRMALTGTISTRTGLLTGLRQLLLSENYLSGSLPKEIGGMKILNSFIVGPNLGLTGSIPDALYDLSKLTTLILTQTSLSGSLGSRIGNLKGLRFLQATSNNLSSSIPTQIGLMSDLGALLLGFNYMSGQLPSQIGLLTNLKALSVAGSLRMSGPLPDELFKATNLAQLAISIPSSGTLSSLVGRLSSLSLLVIGSSDLSGTVPTSIGDCLKLESLVMSSNMLEGSLPSEVGKLQRLSMLDFGGNLGIHGAVPESFYGLGQLSKLELGNTGISGTLSAAIGQLTSATSISFSHTRLKGTIPATLGDLSLLTSLDLSNTLLSGSVPHSICDIRPHGGILEALSVDCSSFSEVGPPVDCPCCSKCCDRSTTICIDK